MVKHLTRSCLAIFVLALLAVGAGLFWLHAQVRSLEWARPSIENALNSEDAAYKVTYAEANLDWRDWSKFGLLEVKNVQISNREGDATVFAKFPAVYVSFSPLGLLTHGQMLHTILLDHPKLLLTRDENKVLRLGLEDSPASVALSDILDMHTDDASSGDSAKHVDLRGDLPFRRLMIRHANLRFTDSTTDTTITSSNSNFDLTRSHGSVDASVNAPFVYNDVPGKLNASLQSSSFYDSHVVNATLAQVPAQLGCLLFTCPKEMSVEGLISGTINLGLNDDAMPTLADINISTKNVKFTDPEIFPEPIVSAQGLLQLQANNGLKSVHLTRLSVGLEDVGFEITGTGHHGLDGWYADIDGRATRMLPITKLYKYWPLPLAHDSRAWVINSIPAGQGLITSFKLHMNPPDWSAPYLPDHALSADIAAQDITCEYLEGFPLMHHINAQVHFTGSTVRILANAGNVLSGTQLKSGDIFFSDLNKPETPVEITAALHAPASDAATILNLKYFPFAKPLKLDPGTISGALDTTMSLKFDAFPKDAAPANPAPAPATDAPKHTGDIDFSRVLYDISARLDGISQPNFADRLNMKNASGDLQASNAGFHVAADAELGGGSPAHVVVSQKAGEDVQVQIDGAVGRGAFAQAGIDISRIGEGSAAAKLDFTVKKDTLLVKKAVLDLTNLALTIPELSWSKARGVAGNFTLTNDGKTYHFSMNADDLKITDATAQIDDAGNPVSADFPSIVTQKDNFSLHYATRSDGFDMALKGSKLDASDSYAKSDNGLLKDFPPMHLTVDLASFTLMPGEPFTDIKGDLQCDAKRCSNAIFDANLGKSTVTADITNVAGVRQLTINASDAGEFLHALNFTDRLHGGRFELSGSYDDQAHPSVFSGHALITECIIKNSAILGRIFSIASLSGIQNALTGSGITFNEISADVMESGGIITVKNGRASGNATGLTVAGTIDTSNAGLKLKGVVVPAYSVNSLLGKIPIIGALAGGEGEGIFAFNYSVEGTYNTPQVHVNPLSGLTPGILRKIFGIFDNEEEEKIKTPKPVEKPLYKDAVPVANADRKSATTAPSDATEDAPAENP